MNDFLNSSSGKFCIIIIVITLALSLAPTAALPYVATGIAISLVGFGLSNV